MFKHSILKSIIPVCCVLALCGCTFHNPAPVFDQSNAQVQRSANSDGTYLVRAGDTLFGIAFSYGLDQRELAQWNSIGEPYTIYPDQLLRLTAPLQASVGSIDVKLYKAATPQATTTRTYTTRDVPAATPTQKPVPPSVAVNAPESSPPLTSPKSIAASPPMVNKPVPGVADKPAVSASAPNPQATQNNVDPSSWRWPTEGRLLRGFVAGDPARNGVDIAGKAGQDVKASASGTVVYSGNGLIGYGELIIIKHSDNMLSAYAHNQVRLVQEGQHVTAGETIAHMGRNDRNEQILHFEIRTRGKPVNPLIYLPRQ